MGDVRLYMLGIGWLLLKDKVGFASLASQQGCPYVSRLAP